MNNSDNIQPIITQKKLHVKDIKQSNKNYNKEYKENKMMFSHNKCLNERNVSITKKNEVDVSIKIENKNEEVLEELKKYANKINDIKINDIYNFQDLISIKNKINNMTDQNFDFKMNYDSLIDFTNSIDEMIAFFSQIDKKIVNVYNISDKILLSDLLNSFKKIYNLLDVFQKFKANLHIHTKINVQLSSNELNNIINTVSIKINDINDKITSFMNDDSINNIDNIMNFLNTDEENEINAALNNSLSSLNNNLKEFNENSAKLKETLNLFKKKLICKN